MASDLRDKCQAFALLLAAPLQGSKGMVSLIGFASGHHLSVTQFQSHMVSI